jgi:ABC-2 type transport system ATP-binding protein
VCDRVLVVAQGKLLCDGTLDALRRSVSRERRLIVDFVDPETQLAAFTARVLKREGSRFTLGFDPEAVSPAALISEIASRHAVRDLFVEHPPIEEVVAELYRKLEGRA